VSAISDTAAPPEVAPPRAPLDPRRRLLAFLSLMAAMFMAMLDNQIVSTALPTIVGELGQLEKFSWVGSAYLLVSSSVMPVYGKLGDLFGRKQVLITAVSAFLVGSLACGLATSMNTLIAARVLQALGGGGIAVSVFSINADLFGPRERARYQSYTSLVLMLSGAVGPVLGGAMSQWLGWRSIFLINMPIGVVVLISLARTLPMIRPKRVPKIDYLGAALLACVIASIVLWADSAALVGGLLTPGGLSILTFGALCLALWIWLERRVPEPVVPLSIFRNRTVALLLIVSLVSGAAGIGLSNYWALFLQSARGMSASAAGLLFIPLTGGIAVGSLSAGRIISITGAYKPFAIASTTISAATLFAVAGWGAAAPLWALAALMSVQGVAIGMGQQTPVLGVQNAARPEDVGAATSTVTLTRMGGASIGISLYGAIIFANVAAAAAPAGLDAAHLDPSSIARLAPAIQAQVAAIYAAACRAMFAAAGVSVAVGALAAMALPDIRLPIRTLR
jgi:EmrB/QacA subfamily drug resistance transporter